MSTITVLPHALCPEGKAFLADVSQSLCVNLLNQGIAIEHACEMSRACTTCHVIVRDGFASLTASTEDEDDLLDRAWGLTPTSRLSCQVYPSSEQDLVIEIPRYTINHAREE